MKGFIIICLIAGGLLASPDLTSDAANGHLITVQPDQATGQALIIDNKEQSDSDSQLQLVTSESLPLFGDPVVNIVSDKVGSQCMDVIHYRHG